MTLAAIEKDQAAKIVGIVEVAVRKVFHGKWDYDEHQDHVATLHREELWGKVEASHSGSRDTSTHCPPSALLYEVEIVTDTPRRRRNPCQYS